jgi:DNA-binding transcriptional LysR family regulator
MDIARLRALRELALRGTMAAAAEALFLTPSAVSQQIAQLEADVGVALTERRGRGVRLTPAGTALVGHAERVMVVLDEARSEMAQLKREIAGELRVAAFPSVASAVLPETVKSLRTVFPRLQIVLDELEPLDGLAALGAWQADVALVDDLSIILGGKHRDFGHQPLTEDVLYVLLPAGHALSRRQSVSVADLRHEAWALDSTSSTFGDFISNLCRRAGYEPSLNARCRGFEMVGAMVASGCSVSIVPGLRLVRPLPGVMPVKLRPEVRRKISVAYRRGERDHPAVKIFVEEVVRTSARLLHPRQ